MKDYGIEEFIVTSSETNVRDAGIRVFGQPLQSEPLGLVELLSTEGLDTFLRREARHSIGNYLLCQKIDNGIRIITSVGYCGGYVHEGQGAITVGTILANVLGYGSDPIEIDSDGVRFLLSYATGSNFNQLPFKTPFKNVTRLPPGTFLEIKNGTITAFKSYLIEPGSLPAPKTFMRAMNEIMGAVQAHFKRNPKTKAGVFFSGGVDCLSIYLGLREHLGKNFIKLFTMEHNSSNGPDRAVPVAKAVGAETEIVPKSVFKELNLVPKIISLMQKDLIAMVSPHLAIHESGHEDTLFFHGQNMDALVNLNMLILQQHQEAGLHTSAAARIAKTDAEKNKVQRAFLQNLQLTDGYLEDVGYQKTSIDVFAAIHSKLRPDPHPGRDGVLRGIMSGQYPNLLAPLKGDLDQISMLDGEIARFRRYAFGNGGGSPRQEADMARFLTYSHLANKRIASFPLEKNSEAVLLAMSGPLTSYYLGRARGLSEANQPKREVYAYAKKLAGKPYRALMKGGEKSGTAHYGSGGDFDLVDALFESSSVFTDPETSRLLKLAENTEAETTVRAVSRNLNDAVAVRFHGRGGRITTFQKGLVARWANLEQVIREAESIKHERDLEGITTC